MGQGEGSRPPGSRRYIAGTWREKAVQGTFTPGRAPFIKFLERPMKRTLTWIRTAEPARGSDRFREKKRSRSAGDVTKDVKDSLKTKGYGFFGKNPRSLKPVSV